MSAGARIDLGAVFDAHMSAEFELRDADRAVETMTDETMLTPSDLTIERISRTMSEDMVIDEFIVRFTHDVIMDAILPGVAPTGRKVELPHVAVVGFEDGKISFERIYWDQGSMLAQLGLLDAEHLPLVGSQQAKALTDKDFPRNQLITG